MNWEAYYSNFKKNFIIALIEWANKSYFTPLFLREFYNIVKKRKNLTILEPGCGSGLMSSYLARSNEVTVLDLSEKALEVAKGNFKNTKGKFIQGNLFTMPFSSNSFDVVWNQGVIEHFENPVPAMKEMMRVAKDYVIIFIPDFFSPLHLVYKLLKLLHLMKLWVWEEPYFFTGTTFKKFMEEAGYKNSRVKRLWKSFGLSQVGYCRK